MNTGTLIRFLGWTSLTYLWLEANCSFFNAIIDAINEHDEQIRQQVLESEDESESENESEDESGNEGDNESEDVIVKTITKTIVVVKKKFLGHPQKFQKVPKSFKISFFSPLKFIRTYFNLLILARTFWNF